MLLFEFFRLFCCLIIIVLLTYLKKFLSYYKNSKGPMFLI